MRKITNLLFLFVIVLSSCSTKYSTLSDAQLVDLNKALDNSGENKKQLELALSNLDGEKLEAMAFLISNMPKSDLENLSADFLIKNLDVAYKARNEFEWTKNLNKDIFFNEVLPYASLNERRDEWRTDFYERFKKYVKGSKNIEEAIWAVNNNIMSEVKVEYNTDREKPDQSPYESMKQGMASCSGLSILLVDAFRSVGIPSRVAGTPDWYNNSGNHNWVEVYVDGKWHFTEYYPSGKFDESWFLERAGKADVNNPKQWIYAASFKKTNLPFPLVWDENIKDVYSENVTDRYIKLYKEELARKNPEGKVVVQLIMLKNKACSIAGNNRVKEEVTIYSDGEEIATDYTSGPNDDMNRYFNATLEKNKTYTLSFKNKDGFPVKKEFHVGADNQQIILYHNSKSSI